MLQFDHLNFNVRPTRGEITIIITHSQNWSKNRAFFSFDLCWGNSRCGSSLVAAEPVDVEWLSRCCESAVETSSGPSSSFISETSFVARKFRENRTIINDAGRTCVWNNLLTFRQPTRPARRVHVDSFHRVAATADEPNNDGRDCWGHCSLRGSHYDFGFMSSQRKRGYIIAVSKRDRTEVSRLGIRAGNKFKNCIV